MICLLTVAFGLTALVAVFAEKKEETPAPRRVLWQGGKAHYF